MWLPENIADLMIEHFGKQLRRELVELIGNTDVLRRRAASNGSQRLSSDSTRDPVIIVPDIRAFLKWGSLRSNRSNPS